MPDSWADARFLVFPLGPFLAKAAVFLLTALKSCWNCSLSSASSGTRLPIPCEPPHLYATGWIAYHPRSPRCLIVNDPAGGEVNRLKIARTTLMMRASELPLCFRAKINLFDLAQPAARILTHEMVA